MWEVGHVQLLNLLGIDEISKLPTGLAKLKQEYDAKIKLTIAKAKLAGSISKPDSRLSKGSVRSSAD